MRKQRAQAVTPQTFKEFVEKFETTVLQGAIIQLEGSIAWSLMQAFLRQRQKEFEVAALDLAGHTGKSQECAKASGYAQACEDTANHFMQELMDVTAGRDGLVEGPVREEV